MTPEEIDSSAYDRLENLTNAPRKGERPGINLHENNMPFAPSKIGEAIKQAREAQKLWASKSFKQRAGYIAAAERYLVKHADEIAYRISVSTGKTRIDALAAEVLPCALACRWYRKHSERHLRAKALPVSSPLFFNKKTELHRLPWGVVAIISPWNYPLAIPFGEIIMGLMAGNAILLKGSPHTTSVTQMIAHILANAALPDGLFQVISGPGEAVATTLFKEGVDKIFFTGSVAVGKSLMQKASETLTPVCLELGGKDPMIVLPDADLERSTNGAIWGAFQHAGQTCAGIERLYVHSSIYKPFLEILAKKTATLRCGKDFDFNTDVGAMTTEAQFYHVSQQVDEAVSLGAKIMAQAQVQADSKGLYYPPTLLVDVQQHMRIMQDETFGPVLAVMPFESTEEAIRLANDSPYALTASIWTKDTAAAKQLAKKLESGVVTINDHLYTHALSEVPWGGAKDSGIGRTHGALGLEEMTQAKAINWDILPSKRNLYWYPHSRHTYKALKAAMALHFPDKGSSWWKALAQLLPYFLQTYVKGWKISKP